MAESGRVLLEFLISHYIRLVRAFESVEDWSKFALLTEKTSKTVDMYRATALIVVWKIITFKGISPLPPFRLHEPSVERLRKVNTSFQCHRFCKQPRQNIKTTAKTSHSFQKNSIINTTAQLIDFKTLNDVKSTYEYLYWIRPQQEEIRCLPTLCRTNKNAMAINFPGLENYY